MSIKLELVILLFGLIQHVVSYQHVSILSIKVPVFLQLVRNAVLLINITLHCCNKSTVFDHELNSFYFWE